MTATLRLSYSSAPEALLHHWTSGEGEGLPFQSPFQVLLTLPSSHLSSSPSTAGFLLVPVFMLCEWCTLFSVRFCVWFCFFNYKMKMMVSCIETEQSIKQSVFLLCSWAMASFLGLFFTPRKHFFQLYLIPRHASPVSDVQLGLILLLLNCEWCDVEWQLPLEWLL